MMNACRCPDQEIDLADPIGGAFRYDCLKCNPTYYEDKIAQHTHHIRALEEEIVRLEHEKREALAHTRP